MEDWFHQMSNPRKIKNLLTYLLTYLCVGRIWHPFRYGNNRFILSDSYNYMLTASCSPTGSGSMIVT